MSADGAPHPPKRPVELLVRPADKLWELRCGHCGKIERYATEKEALDAAADHCGTFGLDQAGHLRVERS